MKSSSVIPVIAGPTASGKSDLAVELALVLRERGVAAEVMAADAFQVYRGMDVGTAKPTMVERRGVRHHLIDLVDPHGGGVVDSNGGCSDVVQHPHGLEARATGDARATFTLDDWLAEAERTIAELRSRGVLPILVGGTALYVQSFLFGLFEGPAADAGLRAELGATDPAVLRAELERADPAAARIHPADTRRTIRAIEVFRATGRPISEHQREWQGRPPRGDARLFILSFPTDELNRRINARVKGMMSAGLLEELRGLVAKGELNVQAREALGYKQLLAHLADPKRVPLEEAVEKIKIETRRFGKNQRTWMKRLGGTPGAVVMDAAGMPREAMVESIIASLGVP